MSSKVVRKTTCPSLTNDYTLPFHLILPNEIYRKKAATAMTPARAPPERTADLPAPAVAIGGEEVVAVPAGEDLLGTGAPVPTGELLVVKVAVPLE